jgi:hypothetical protein
MKKKYTIHKLESVLDDFNSFEEHYDLIDTTQLDSMRKKITSVIRLIKKLKTK